MAEGIANKILPNNILIKSAGTEAHGVNPIAVEVMNDISIPISHHQSEKINYHGFLIDFEVILPSRINQKSITNRLQKQANNTGRKK